MVFIFCSLEKDASLAKSSSAYFPHCVVTKSSLYIPTFELSQEQLVSSVSTSPLELLFHQHISVEVSRFGLTVSIIKQ